MFSVFCYVAGILYEYDTNTYAGIRVDFENIGIYYDPEYGPNWWNYYCEPCSFEVVKREVIMEAYCKLQWYEVQ